MLHAHLVFVVEYGGNVFRAEHLGSSEEVFRNFCADFKAELTEFNGGTDHIHPLVNYPPKVAASRLVNSLKGVSSRCILSW